jgi:hypothetical protein
MEGSGMYMVDGISLAVPSAEHSRLGADSTLINFVHISLTVGPIELKPSAFEKELNSTQNGYILSAYL